MTDLKADSVSLAWDSPDSDGGAPIKQYLIVMRDAKKKKFKKVGKVEGNVTSFAVTSNLEPNGEYYFRVYAENQAGVSESAAELDNSVKVHVRQIKYYCTR